MWANRLAILLLSVCLAVCARGCPGGCTCTMVGRGRKKGGASDLAASAPIGRRVICHSGDALTSVEQVSPSTLEMDTIVLDLSGNAIKVIRSGSFMGLSMLQKLDLSDNQITQIEAGAFLGLDNLLRLNLSNNQLGRLGKGIFDGIPKLERLSLSGNQIKGLPQGIFDNLPVLKKVDFQSDFLVCDCNLQWIVKWLKMTSVQLRSTTVCAVPMQLKEKTVKSLKKKDYHCNWPVELPLFELTPATSQVVFQGDKLPFVCRASVIDSSTRMVWIREGKPVLTNKTVGIFVHTRYSPDRTVMINSLVLEKLALKDSGIWQCRVQTMRGNVSKTVNIIVISVDTLYCRKKVTITNKGTFTWPKTVAGVTAVALCETGRASGYTAPSSPHAYHKCSSQGSWEDLTVDQCQYESEVTRVLEQYAKFDLQNMTKLVSRANQLKGYLKTAKTITDKMDVIFTSRIVERLGRLVSDYERLSDIILHIVSVMMSADDSLLLEAQKEEAACSRMVRAVESIPKQLLKEKKVISRYVDNIALEAHNVNSETFLGITCMSFAPQTRRGVYNEDSFSCTSHGNHSDEVPEGKSLEASIHIPADIFKSVRCLPVCSSSNNFKLQFITYKNAKLFPVLGPASLDMVVKSSVISARIVDVTVENTTSPIEVKLLTREAGTDHTAVYWDFEAQKGLGQWVTRGCTLQSLDGDISLIRCSQLKSFAVMQSWQTASSSLPSWLWGCFNMGAAIYAGTSVLAICVMATLITYILYHGSIKMPRKSRHAVANLCIGLLLLCVTYTLGIHTEQPRLACHVIGIIIHYLSLVTLAWITILAFTIYKKFSKAVQPPPLPEDLPDNPPLPKPILGFYLVGWGVAMLVCGITAAISLEHYITGNQYCFLSTEARMFALYAPAAFLASICVIFFLSMCCLLREGPRDPADLIDDVSDVHLAGNELDSVTPTTNLTNTTALSSSVMDLEYRPVVQLYGVVMVLFLYLFTWTCGAFVVALPFGSLLPHREMVYNYLYGFTSAALGIFILVFYCLAREDARGCWRNSCCKKDVQPEAVAMATNPSNGHVMRHRGSIELSISGKSSNSTNRTPSVLCAPKVTNISSQAGGTATDLSLGSYQECATFYNPRQNGIAKKYWQKNRLRSQLHKGLNMGSGPLMHGPGDGSRTFSDDSFKRRSYGNGSDANTHLSIEIELQPKNSNFCPPGDSADRVYSGLAAPGKYPELHPAVAAQYLPRGCCQLTPVPGTQSPTAGVYTPEVPTNSYPVLPSHITAMYSLPRSTLHDDQPLQVNEFMQRNGSVPRLRDFDGQSHVSSQVTSTHELGAASVNSDARTGDTINNLVDERRPQRISTKEPPPKIAPKPPLSSFMDQLQQRIPPSNDSRSSTPREQSHFHKPDSNAELKVLPSVEKPQPHSSRPEKHPKPSSKSPPRTLDPDHPPCVPVVKASYAAVCQLSREASLERLLPTSPQAASQDPDESENLLPKGGYAEGHSDPGNEDELSGEENGDDIWVPRKEKSKHETSV